MDRFWLQWSRRERLLLILLIVAVLCAVGFFVMGHRPPSGEPFPLSSMPAPSGNTPQVASQGSAAVQSTSVTQQSIPNPVSDQPTVVKVDVKGAVAHPGVYALQPDDRIEGALQAAGGATSKAALDNVNLAQRLSDGMVIRVPVKGEKAVQTVALPVTETPDTRSGASPEAPSAAVPSKAAEKPAQGAKVNVNTADASALEALSGIGPAKAAAIVAYRQEHGPFRNVDDLLDVSGIGPKVLDQIRDAIVLW
ncbi:MAG: helix-hairpin-helix domain-containing protein [Firmicutes bacterium]|nr:helix-hairpin-helix domain-containing protein [Bacillota bacterium]